MKIDNLRSEKIGNRARAVATVIWEDCDRPPQETYFETTEKYAEGLSCNPHAFLVGSILPAMHHGEKRIFIDAEICPELRDGLMTSMSWIRHWRYGPESELVRIEAKTRSYLPTARAAARAGVFFSGGIDGLAQIRLNRLSYPREHPGSFKDALIMFGPYWESNDRPETFEQAMSDLSDFARDAAIELIPVYTNIRDLDKDTMRFIYEYHGAILASVAHAFSRRLSAVTISSTDDIPSLALLKRKDFRILGSHPLLDPNYSSSDLLIKHGSVTLSRFDKTKLLADWGVAINSIKVCQPNWPGPNCGICEKCVRTELALLALDLLDKTKAFPLDDLTEKQVEAITLGSDAEQNWTAHHEYLELIEPLRAKGRNDLVRAINNVFKRYPLHPELDWKMKVKRFDNRYLNGSLLRVKRLFY